MNRERNSDSGGGHSVGYPPGTQSQNQGAHKLTSSPGARAGKLIDWLHILPVPRRDRTFFGKVVPFGSGHGPDRSGFRSDRALPVPVKSWSGTDLERRDQRRRSRSVPDNLRFWEGKGALAGSPARSSRSRSVVPVAPGTILTSPRLSDRAGVVARRTTRDNLNISLHLAINKVQGPIKGRRDRPRRRAPAP